MKEIPLTRGLVAKVDDEDFEVLNKHRWYAHRHRGHTTWYARRKKKGQPGVYMHRQILGLTDPKVLTDHENHDGLDNQRHNIRQATPLQNNANRRKQSNTANRLKGVHWDKKRKRWEAGITYKGKRTRLGRFRTEEAAGEAYRYAARLFYGEFACV